MQVLESLCVLRGVSEAQMMLHQQLSSFRTQNRKRRRIHAPPTGGKKPG
jgi:hypothetical protein